MTTFAQVQEALYQRFDAMWTALGRNPAHYKFADEKFDPPDGIWAAFSVQPLPRRQETLGAPGGRRFAQRGTAFIQLRRPPLSGAGDLVTLAETMRPWWEAVSVPPYAVKFEAFDIGEGAIIDGERYWGLTAQAAFQYEDRR